MVSHTVFGFVTNMYDRKVVRIKVEKHTVDVTSTMRKKGASHCPAFQRQWKKSTKGILYSEKKYFMIRSYIYYQRTVVTSSTLVLTYVRNRDKQQYGSTKKSESVAAVVPNTCVSKPNLRLPIKGTL